MSRLAQIQPTTDHATTDEGMSSPSEHWYVNLSYPDTAIPLPVDETEDISAWAESTAWSRLPPEATAEAISEFAEALIGATLDSRTRSPLYAYFLSVYPEHGELARIEVQSISPESADEELTVEQMAGFFSAPEPTSLNPAQVTPRTLPAGPAARIAHQYVGEPDEAGDSTVTQTLAYAVRPPDIRQGIVLFLTWSALYFSDELFELGDIMAESIQVKRK